MGARDIYMEKKWKNGGEAMKYLIILFLPLVMFATCNENARVDETKNQALENLCNGDTLNKLLEKDLVNVFREYVCMCQQGAKKSDQNLCEPIVDGNNKAFKIKACELKEVADNKDKCYEIFSKRN